jgi:outer membrane protein assembly factor BamA
MFKSIKQRAGYFWPLIAVLSVIPLAILSSAPIESSSKSGDYRLVSESGPVVFAVKIVGNKITSSEMINREMMLKPGVIATHEKIEADRLHLLSLGLFNHVDISLANDQGRAVVLVQVTEKFYIYPVPVIRYDPLAPKRRILGLEIHNDNFRGNGENLTLAWWDGYERGAYLWHRDRWYSINGKYGISSRLFYTDNELSGADGSQFTARTEAFLTRVARRIGRASMFGIEGEWEERSAKSDFYTLSKSGRDRLLSTRFMLEDEERDFVYYPTAGHYLSAVTEIGKMIDTGHTYFIQSVDLRAYQTFGGCILAGRFWTKVSYRNLPYYRLIELSTKDVRSKEPIGVLGKRIASTSLELRFNILKMRYFSYPDVIYFGEYLRRMKFSVEGVFFGDQGYVGGRFSSAISDLTPSAFGCGLQFQLPYVETARMLVSWKPGDRFTVPNWFFDTGVTF